MRLSEKEKEELMRLAASSSLRDDMRQLAVRRHDSLVARGEADSDEWIAFLNGYNAFVNHIPKTLPPHD